VTTNGARAPDLPIPSLDGPSAKSPNATVREEVPGDEDKRMCKLKSKLKVTLKVLMLMLKALTLTLTLTLTHQDHRPTSMLPTWAWSKFLNSLAPAPTPS
jgi:hypothetical protein